MISFNASLFFLIILVFSNSIFVDAAFLVGIVDKFQTKTDWSYIGEFCFVVPLGKQGQIQSNIVAEAPGHHFVVLKDKDLNDILASSHLHEFSSRGLHAKRLVKSRLLGEQHDAEVHLEVLNSTAAPVVNFTQPQVTEQTNNTLSKSRQPPTGEVRPVLLENDLIHSEPKPFTYNYFPNVRLNNNPSFVSASTVCERLLERARVDEKLELLTEWKHTTIWTQPHVSMHRVSVLILRCGSTPAAEYIIKFKNPGSFFQTHFSCFDHGILENYMLFFLGSVFLWSFLYPLWKISGYARREKLVVATFFLGVIAFTVSIGFMMLHFIVYALDGIGLGPFAFLAYLANLVFGITMASVIFCVLELHEKTTKLHETLETNFTKSSSFSSECSNQFLSPSSLFQAMRISSKSEIAPTLAMISRSMLEPNILFILFASSLTLHTLFHCLKTPLSGELLSPVSKLLLLHWTHYPLRRFFSWSDMVSDLFILLHLVTRCLFGGVLFYRSYDKKMRYSSYYLFESCLWLGLPLFLTIFCRRWIVPVPAANIFIKQSALIIITLSNFHIIMANSSTLKELIEAWNEETQRQCKTDLNAERQSLVGLALASRTKTLETNEWKTSDDAGLSEPELLDLKHYSQTRI